MIQTLNEIRFGSLKLENINTTGNNIEVLKDDIRAYDYVLEYVYDDDSDWEYKKLRSFEKDNESFSEYFSLLKTRKSNTISDSAKYYLDLVESDLHPDPELGCPIYGIGYQEYAISYNQGQKEWTILVGIISGHPDMWDHKIGLLYARYKIVADDLHKKTIQYISKPSTDFKSGLAELVVFKNYIDSITNEEPFHKAAYEPLTHCVDELILIFQEKLNDSTTTEIKIKWKGTLKQFADVFFPLLENKLIDINDYNSRTDLLKQLYGKFDINKENKDELVQFTGFKFEFDDRFREKPKFR